MSGFQQNVGGVVVGIQHLNIGPLDVGIEGKHNFLSLFVLGLVFLGTGGLPLGEIAEWFKIFGYLMLIGAMVLFGKLITGK
ncbi:hypothetical protein HY095_05550 [Candidatus Micrarchaeota archaeon]|nr:hypothetical protein [Candidatus Micrarchaeota archaeon]